MLHYVSYLVEGLIADYYARKYSVTVFQPVGYFPPHDGTALNARKDLRYEVKLDAKAQTSGNLAFEVSFNGKPSGLTTTEAYTWDHVVPENENILRVYEFSVPALRELTKGRDIVPGGDNNQSGLVLIPIEQAMRHTLNIFWVSVSWEEIRPYWVDLYAKASKKPKR